MKLEMDRLIECGVFGDVGSGGLNAVSLTGRGPLLSLSVDYLHQTQIASAPLELFVRKVAFLSISEVGV